MSTLESAIDQLPQPILDKLQSMISRVRRLLFIRGFFATLAVGILCLLAIMAIDATFTIFSSTARWALSLVGLGITLVAGWWYLVRPLSRKFTLTHMARILEIRHPELQERISTAVELMGSDDPDSIKGSQELISAVVDSAVVDIEAVDPKAEFKPARSRKFLAVGVTALVIMLLTLAIWPKQSWTLLTRAVAPFLDIGNAYANSLVVNPGDIRVATGSPVTIEVSVKHKRLKRAEIRRLLADGTEAVERMTLIGEDEDGTKRFAMTFPSVTENFDYRVRAGSAVSEYYDVDAIDPPVVEELRISYDYPDYTALENISEVTETGEIRAIAHTKVKVEATLNRPVWTSKMFINEDREVELLDSSGNQVSWGMDLKSGTNGSWRIELADEEGFTNEAVTFPIEVLPDKAPTVQITEPTQKEFKLRPTETLPINAAITEDFGIAKFTMLVTPDGAATPTSVAVDLPAKVDDSGLHYGRAILNIASLNLEAHQKRIAVQLRAEDNRPADYDGPGVGLSEMIYITLDQKAKSLADQAIEAQKKEVTEKIREAKRELERARDDMRRTEQELQRSDEVKPETRQRLDEFSEHTEKARENLDEVAAELGQSIFQEQAKQAEKISDENLAAAMEKADMIPVTDEKAERVTEARESREEIEKSIRELDSLAKSMREADEDYRAISELNQLANKQQELAQNAKKWAEEAQKRPEQMVENAQKQFDQAQQKELNQFQQKQNQVEKELGEMLKENAAALSEVLEEQKQHADAMSAQADALAKKQESLKEANQKATQSRDDQQEALKEQLIQQLQAMQTELAEEASQAQQAAEKAQDAASADQQSQNTSTPEGNTQEKSEQASESLAEAASKAAEAAGELEDRKLAEATESALSASKSLSDAADQTSESASNEAPTESAQNTEGAPTAEMASNEQTAEEGAPSAPENGDSDTASEGDPTNEPSSSEAAAASEEGSTPAAAQLAERQEAIAEQIAAVRDGNLQEALSLMEQALAAEADALQNEAEQFEQTMQNLSQNNAKSSADRAENALEQGTREAKEASKQLDQAQAQQAQAEAKGQLEEGKLASNAQQAMQRSQSDQAQSANQLAQAAQHLANTATNIGQTMEGLEPTDADERIANSDDLAEGFEEVSEASESSSAQEAAQQSQEAASSLQKLAQQAMQKLGKGQQGNQPPQNGQGEQMPPQDLAGDPQSDNLNETGKKTADANGSGVPPELLEMGINAEDWARFKGALTGGNATAIETELPAEYRELVGRYFQVIAKEAGKK